MHVEDGKRHEDRQGDNFLHDLELRQIQRAVAQTIGGHLEEIFEQGDTPARQGGDVPGSVVEVAQVGYQAKVMKTLEQKSRNTVVQMDGSSSTGSVRTLRIYGVSARKCTEAARLGWSQCSNDCSRLALAPHCRTVEIPGVCGVFRGLEVLGQTPFLGRNRHLNQLHSERCAKTLAQSVLHSW